MNSTKKPIGRRTRAVMYVTATVASLLLSASTARRASACLTSNIDKRTIQWSAAIVQAKLVSLGTKMPLTANVMSPSGKTPAEGYRVVTFQIMESIDGSLQSDQTIKVLGLVGGKAGDGSCPALMPESVGKKFILMLRPFEQTHLDLANGTQLNVGPGAMVIVSQLGEDDMNADTMRDLTKLVKQSRDASASVTSDTIGSQVEAVAAAHDDTEAEQAEKALEDIGPAALPALQERIKSTSGVSTTRLRRIISDVQPPMLTAQPE